MADKKLRFALLTQFKKHLSARGKSSYINMFAQQWAADALIESFGYDECVEGINYYFKINSSPDWTWLSYNMEKVLQAMKLEEEDQRIRAVNRARAREWLK
jgi:hypothetical protein